MKNFLFLFVLGVGIFGSVLGSFAATCPDRDAAGNPIKPGTVCLDNPLGTKIKATDIIGTLIKGALGVLGSLALLMLVWGGFQWMTSAGNTEKVEKGTSTMLWAIIGVIVVLSSYLLVNTLTTVLSTGKAGP